MPRLKGGSLVLRGVEGLRAGGRLSVAVTWGRVMQATDELLGPCGSSGE